MSKTVSQKTSVFLKFLFLFLIFSAFTSYHVFSQGTVVTGKVTGASGEAISGASVLVKGTTTGTSTNNEGSFSINVPNPNATLVVTSSGAKRLEVGLDGRTTVPITLETTNTQLEQVVVIGYGTASRRDLTGSIAKVSGKDIANKPNSNPVASLQSKVAGLSVVNSGQAGREPDIRIRGTISIGSVKPLYVVDGIFNDNIDFINPSDIESIEVLKDPSSLAIFGVRGAAGVIAVTTKKARAGQTIVNFNSTYGVKKLVDKIKLADASEFKMLYNEELANQNKTAYDFSKWTGNTDWIEALSQDGNFSATNISVTGSTEKNKFYMGAGYTLDEGIVLREKLQKLLLSVNDEYKISNALKVGFNFSGVRQKLPYNYYNGSNILYDARRIVPIVEPFDAQSGLYTHLPDDFQGKQITNPLLTVENTWDKNLHYEHRMVGSIFAEVNFLKSFNFKSTLYADITNGDRTIYNPIIYTFDPGAPIGSQIYKDNSGLRTTLNTDKYTANKYQQDYILTFKKKFGDHGLTAIAGWTTYYQSDKHQSATASQKLPGDSIPNDKRFWYIDNLFVDAQSRRASSSQWERATASFLFRVLYNYQGKYFLNASFRRDGSSIISPSNRWQNFQAIGAAWEVSKEGFMANQKIFDFLKLKASWGILGNQNTYEYNYPFYPALNANNAAVFGNNVFPAYSQTYLPNPNLKWETVKAKEVGVEFNVLNNRLHLEALYYDKTTEDVLVKVPGISGAIPGLDNIGNITNSGIELIAGWNQQIARDFNLTASANLTTFKNKVVSLSTGGYEIPPSEEYPNRTTAGYPIGYFYGYVREGVYQNADEIAKSPAPTDYTPQPGDLKFADLDGDNKITSKDRTNIGNPTPKFSYGGSVNLNYKGLDIGVDVGGVSGNQIYRYFGTSELTFAKFNYPEFRLNRWHGEGTSNTDPAVNDTRTNNSKFLSTWGIESGSYFRIRNLQLGYNFNRAVLEKARIKTLRIFVNAQNLKTWKSNSGFSPEFGGSAISFGIDNGSGAIPAVYTAGINVTF